MSRWLLGRPDGVAEWTFSSFASAMALVGAWCVAVVSAWLSIVFQQVEEAEWGMALWRLAYLAAVGAHLLLWWQVVRGVWALYRDADAGPAWPLAIAVLWWVALLVFQVLGLLLWRAVPFPAATGGLP
jgi:hypothetical protein